MLTGFPQAGDDHVFALEGSSVPYECTCRFLDIFEGATYLAWKESCPVHQTKPQGMFEQVSSLDDLITKHMEKGLKR